MKWIVRKDGREVLSASTDASWYTDGKVIYQGDLSLLKWLPGCEGLGMPGYPIDAMQDDSFGMLVDSIMEKTAYTNKGELERDFDITRHRWGPDILFSDEPGPK